MPDRKTNFCSKFAIKTLPCYHCKCWHWKSKVSPYSIWYIFGPHAGEIWTKLNGPKCTKLWQKNEFFKTIFDNVLMTETMFNAKLLFFRLLYFSVTKVMVVHVKSWNKHSRPELSIFCGLLKITTTFWETIYAPHS